MFLQATLPTASDVITNTGGLFYEVLTPIMFFGAGIFATWLLYRGVIVYLRRTGRHS